MTESIFRPLHLAEKLLVETGRQMTYAYEDLVFDEHAVTILQLPDSENSPLALYVRKEMEVRNRSKIVKSYIQASERISVPLYYKGVFTLEETPENESINLVFEYEKKMD